MTLGSVSAARQYSNRQVLLAVGAWTAGALILSIVVSSILSQDTLPQRFRPTAFFFLAVSVGLGVSVGILSVHARSGRSSAGDVHRAIGAALLSTLACVALLSHSLPLLLLGLVAKPGEPGWHRFILAYHVYYVLLSGIVAALVVWLRLRRQRGRPVA